MVEAETGAKAETQGDMERHSDSQSHYRELSRGTETTVEGTNSLWQLNIDTDKPASSS